MQKSQKQIYKNDTDYLLSNSTNAKHLLKGITAVKNGKVIKRALIKSN